MRSNPIEDHSTIDRPPVSIDGVTAIRRVAPETPSEAAEMLADAAAKGDAVSPFGGGTSLALGNIPERLDIALSTEQLRGVINYEPTDLTLSVGAGSRFADVQAVLAEHGQNLPIETPDPDRSTIGGLIATAMSGPRRYGSGTLRDLLIGVSAVHPSGTVTKAGGMVVKNVTGFDLMRLYHGSLGTLGVIVSANFKVLPLARLEATVLAECSSFSIAMEAANRIKASRVFPVAIELFRHAQNPWRIAIRVEGRDATVRLLAAEARQLLGLDATTVEGRESASWWRSYVADQTLKVSKNEAFIRCVVAPKRVSDAVETSLRSIEECGGAVKHVAVSPGLGTIVVRLVLPESSTENRLLKLQSALLSSNEHVVVLAADPDLKSGIDVMRAIKEQFDPNRVLNPGRFAGHL